MSAITAKASRKMKKYAVLTREPRCFLGSFDFSWEQRKAKEICSIGTGKSNTQDQVDDGKYPFYIRSDVPVRSNKYLYDCEAVITIGDGNIGKVFHYVNGKFDLHQKCDKMTDFKDIWGKYFFYYFSTKFYDRAMKMTAKATVDSVRLEMISEMDIKKPPQISEQKQIAEFFANLDNLITLHQRKCANLCSPSQVVFSLLFATSTFSWEQRKLGEIGSVSMCRRIFKEQTSETGDIPFYKIGTFGADPDAFISRELFEEYKSKYPYPQKGDILISASGSIGRTVEFAGNNEYFQDSNIVWLNHDERLSNPFLKCFYSVVKWAGIEGSTIKRLYNDNILNTVICMPSVPEQKRIGLFFENLDNLITLHQRECISFTGRADRLILTANKKRTTSSWEQRKLGDIASDMVAGGDIDKDLILAEGQYPVIANALTGDGIVGYYDKEYRVNAPAVTVTGRGDVGHAKARLVNFTPVVRLLSVKSEHDVFFLENAINTLKIVIESTGVPQLTVPQLAKYEVAFPRQLDEEEHIGAFFKQLDHLITLHQRKPFLMKWRTSDANRNQTNRLVL